MSGFAAQDHSSWHATDENRHDPKAKPSSDVRTQPTATHALEHVDEIESAATFLSPRPHWLFQGELRLMAQERRHAKPGVVSVRIDTDDYEREAAGRNDGSCDPGRRVTSHKR